MSKHVSPKSSFDIPKPVLDKYPMLARSKALCVIDSWAQGLGDFKTSALALRMTEAERAAVEESNAFAERVAEEARIAKAKREAEIQAWKDAPLPF